MHFFLRWAAVTEAFEGAAIEVGRVPCPGRGRRGSGERVKGEIDAGGGRGKTGAGRTDGGARELGDGSLPLQSHCGGGDGESSSSRGGWMIDISRN